MIRTASDHAGQGHPLKPEDFSRNLDFDALLQRIHPAASRIKRLAQETPATYLVFDLLLNERGKRLTEEALSARRMALQDFAENFRGSERVYLSPATSDFATAQRWMQQGTASGLDGVVAKRLDCEYTSGERTGMVKVKRIRTADCVVGGFRWAQKGGEVGSLLLGLYNDAGQLDHVGFSSSFSREDRQKLKAIVTPLITKSGEGGFTGKRPEVLADGRLLTATRNGSRSSTGSWENFSSTIFQVDVFVTGRSFCAGVQRKSRSNAEWTRLRSRRPRKRRADNWLRLCRWLQVACLAVFFICFQLPDKPISLPRQCFYVAGLVCLIREDLAEFVHGLVKAQLEIRRRFARPKPVLEVFAGYNFAGTFQQHGQDLAKLRRQLQAKPMF